MFSHLGKLVLFIKYIGEIMKKRLVNSILVFICVSTLSYGQILDRYGLKAGATFSDQKWEYTSFDFEDNFDNRTGITIGAFAEVINFGNFGIQSELNYIQRGMQFDVNVTIVDGPDSKETETIKNRTDYLSLALLAKYSLNISLISPYILAGPRLDFYIDKNVHKVFAEIYEDFNNQLYGGTIGAGVEVSVLPFDLFTEFRYDFDFNKAYEKDFLDITSKSFYFTVGIFLNSIFEK
jgi:hypothetical protein